MSRLLFSAACGLGLLTSLHAEDVFLYPTPDSTLGSYLEHLSADGQGAVYTLYDQAENRTWAIWRNDSGFSIRDPLLADLDGYSTYIEGIDYTGTTLLLSGYGQNGNRGYFWTPDKLIPFDLGENYVSGLSGDGARAYGFDSTANQAFWVDQGGNLTRLDNSEDIYLVGADKTGSVLVGNRYDSETGLETTLVSRGDGAFEEIQIDGQATSAEAVSGDGSTIALTLSSGTDSYAVPARVAVNDPLAIYLYRGDALEEILLPMDKISSYVESLSYDGSHALIAAYNADETTEYFLHLSELDYTVGIDPLLKELLPEQVVDYYDLELTLDGHSLLGSAYTTEDLNVGFRIDNIDTLVVPEPETYALFGLGLGMIGIFVWRRRRA